MGTRRPLPAALHGLVAFTVARALAEGASSGRLSARDLHAPYRSVRTTAPCRTVIDAARAYAVRMPSAHVFSGVTAARLWGLPLPTPWLDDEKLVVAAPHGTPRAQNSEVLGHEYDPARFESGMLHDLPVLGPVATVLVLARELEHDDIVVLLDAVLTPSARYPGLMLRRPHATVALLTAFAARCKGVPGVRAFRAAIRDARAGSDSPQESRTRLCIVRAGMQEPVMQHPVYLDGALVAVLDLAYPELKIDIEYEGEHHLTDPAQWARDIERQELLATMGWIVIRLTKRDLRDGGRPAIARVTAALARRRAGPIHP